MVTNVVDQVPTIVFDLMDEVGCPKHVKGYNYIAYAVHLASQDLNKIDQVTKVLYPEVANAFDTTASRVERAIRHTVELAHNETDVYSVDWYFKGIRLSHQKDKPTNSQFIAALARQARRQLIG